MKTGLAIVPITDQQYETFTKPCSGMLKKPITFGCQRGAKVVVKVVVKVRPTSRVVKCSAFLIFFSSF